MNGVGCNEVAAMAGELALGVVSGRERADGLAHLAACGSCRQLVADLSQSADALLVVGPVAEPPAGFESSVVNRLRAEQQPAPRTATVLDRHALLRRRRSWAALGVAAALVLVSAALISVVRSDGGHSTAVAFTRTAAMSSPNGSDVGRLVVTGRPNSVFVALPGWRQLEQHQAGYGYRLRARLDTGRTVVLGPMRLADPESTWGTVTRFDVRRLRAVAMVDDDGHVLCSATLAK